MDKQDDVYEIDLLQILDIVREKIVLLLVILIFFCSVAFAITKLVLKEEFTAEAKMIIVQKSDAAANQQNYTYSDVQLSQKLVSTYSQIIMSEAISDEVIANLDLFNKYEIDSEEYSKIVTVKAADNTEVINIDVTTNDPELSADIANEIVDVFETKIYDIMQIENVTTLTEAKIPQKKSGPSTVKNVAIGGALGLVVCAVIVFLQLFTDTKVKTEDEVKAIFNYPIIGNIPYFEVDDEEMQDDDKEDDEDDNL